MGAAKRRVWSGASICIVLSEHGLSIAPSTTTTTWPGSSSLRAGAEVRDKQLEVEVPRVHTAQYGVYSARKV